MKNIASIYLSLYNSLTINIEMTIMKNRQLKLKQVRQEIFKNNLFLNNLTKIKYKKSPLADIVRGELKSTFNMGNSPN